MERYNSQGKGFASITAVKNWFYGNAFPFWALYSGTVVKNQSLVVRNINTEDIDHAWESLRGFLDDYSINGGTFTVTVAKVNKNAGTSLPRTVVTLPKQGVPSINGKNQNQYNNGIGLLRKSEEQIREEERNKVTLERDMEDLRAEIEGIRHESRSTLEVVSGFAQSPNGAAIINHIAGLFIPQKPNVAIAGLNQVKPNQPAEEVEEDFIYDEDNVILVMDKIRDQTGDEEFPAFLDKLKSMTEGEMMLFVNYVNAKK